jgi:hypothetical protein
LGVFVFYQASFRSDTIVSVYLDLLLYYFIIQSLHRPLAHNVSADGKLPKPHLSARLTPNRLL